MTAHGSHGGWTESSFGDTTEICSAFQLDLSRLVDGDIDELAAGRALVHLEKLGIIQDEAELDGARRVLRAAAWTYVAASVAAVGSWAMYLLMSRRR